MFSMVGAYNTIIWSLGRRASYFQPGRPPGYLYSYLTLLKLHLAHIAINCLCVISNSVTLLFYSNIKHIGTLFLIEFN